MQLCNRFLIFFFKYVGVFLFKKQMKPLKIKGFRTNYGGERGIRRLRPFARMLVTSPTVASAPVPGSYNLLKMLAQEHFLNANCPHGFESLTFFAMKLKTPNKVGGH